MTTIHSSSLSFQPAGYLKPERSAFESRAITNSPADQAQDQPRQQSAPASTPRQIRAALEQSGLNGKDNLPQASNSRTAKALANYSQTSNQTAHDQLSTMITGIDLFA